MSGAAAIPIYEALQFAGIKETPKGHVWHSRDGGF